MGRVGLTVVAVLVARRTRRGLRGRWELNARRGRTVIRHSEGWRKSRKSGLSEKDERFAKLKSELSRSNVQCVRTEAERIKTAKRRMDLSFLYVALIRELLCDSNDKKRALRLEKSMDAK